jgi:hypothetical protein
MRSASRANTSRWGLLELRALAQLSRILDRQRMQIEQVRELLKLPLGRRLEVEPEEPLRRDVLRDVVVFGVAEERHPQAAARRMRPGHGR